MIFIIMWIIIVALLLRSAYLSNELEMRELEKGFDNILRQLKELNK